MIHGVPDFMYFIVYYISVSIQKLNDAPVLGAIYLKSKWNLVSKYSNFHSSLYSFFKCCNNDLCKKKAASWNHHRFWIAISGTAQLIQLGMNQYLSPSSRPGCGTNINMYRIRISC